MIDTRPCAVCGQQFEPRQPERGWAPQKYCSEHCRNRRPRTANYRTEEYRAKQRARNAERRDYFREYRRKQRREAP